TKSDVNESAHSAEYLDEHADRLRLDESDTSQEGNISADERQAQEKALAHVRQEVEKLETEIDALSDVLKQDSDQHSDEGSTAESPAIEQADSDSNITAKDSTATLKTEARTPVTTSAQGSGQHTSAESNTESSGTEMLNGEEPGENALASTHVAAQQNTDMETSWIQKHFIKLMLALLAFVVIFTVWILRRANKTTVELESPDRVTDEMIQAKLQDINLDLEVPPTDESGDVGRSDKP